MDRTPVESSNIASIGYDAGTGTLEMEFHNGKIYQYFDVPEHVYQDIMSASTHGQFFHQNIRGIYRYARA